MVNVKWVMFVTQINAAKVTHQINIRTLIFHPKIIILATLVPYQQEKKEEDVAMEPVLPRLFFLNKSVLIPEVGETRISGTETETETRGLRNTRPRLRLRLKNLVFRDRY